MGLTPIADFQSIAAATSAPGQPAAKPKDAESFDEPFDPFAKSDEAGSEEYDPWEPLNTKVFEFTRQVDRFVLKPVGQGL